MTIDQEDEDERDDGREVRHGLDGSNAMTLSTTRSITTFLACFVACAGIVHSFGCDDQPPARPQSAPPRVEPGVPRPKPVPSRHLIREEGAFVHVPAQVRLRLPEGWRALEEPTDEGAIAILKLEGEERMRVTLSITPLERGRELGDVAFNEAGALRELKKYGPDRIVDPVQDSPAGRSGWRIDIAPPEGEREHGVMWLFAARADSDSPWRVKLRATLPAGTTADRLDPLIAALALPNSDSARPGGTGTRLPP